MGWTGHVRFPKTISDNAKVENVSSGCRPSPNRLLGVLYCQTENPWIGGQRSFKHHHLLLPTALLPFEHPLTCCFCTFDKASNPHDPSRASEVGTHLLASANRKSIAYSSRIAILDTPLDLLRLPSWPSTLGLD